MTFLSSPCALFLAVSPTSFVIDAPRKVWQFLLSPSHSQRLDTSFLREAESLCSFFLLYLELYQVSWKSQTSFIALSKLSAIEKWKKLSFASQFTPQKVSPFPPHVPQGLPSREAVSPPFFTYEETEAQGGVSVYKATQFLRLGYHCDLVCFNNSIYPI